jgi:hypothetical protein
MALVGFSVPTSAVTPARTYAASCELLFELPVLIRSATTGTAQETTMRELSEWLPSVPAASHGATSNWRQLAPQLRGTTTGFSRTQDHEIGDKCRR